MFYRRVRNWSLSKYVNEVRGWAMQDLEEECLHKEIRKSKDSKVGRAWRAQGAMVTVSFPSLPVPSRPLNTCPLDLPVFSPEAVSSLQKMHSRPVPYM